MNLVGKIITVMLFVMSLMFMGLAVVTYATGQNYKELVNGGDDGTPLSAVLQQSREKLEARQAEVAQLKMRLAHEQGSRRSALAALEMKSRELTAGLASQNEQFALLVQAHRENVELIGTSQQKIGELKNAVDQARTQLETDFQERDKVLKSIATVTDEFHQGEGQLRRLKERSAQLQRR